MKGSPHSGHSTRSKTVRRILSGVIRHPHFGQTALRDALTVSRLIFFRGTREIVSRYRAERADLYSDDVVIQYSKAMNADVPYQTYPAMANAGTLLLQRHSPMGDALSTVPAFRVEYRDDVAVVLTRP